MVYSLTYQRKVIRLLPPFIINEEEMGEFVFEIVEAVNQFIGK